MSFDILSLNHLIRILKDEFLNSIRVNILIIAHIKDFEISILNVDFLFNLIFQKLFSLLYHNKILNQGAEEFLYLWIDFIDFPYDFLRLIHKGA